MKAFDPIDAILESSLSEDSDTSNQANTSLSELSDRVIPEPTFESSSEEVTFEENNSLSVFKNDYRWDSKEKQKIFAMWISK